MTREGGCACGEVRYRLLESPMFVHCCHCSWCQRETGSAFVVNALIETSYVDLVSGDPGCVEVPTNSGRSQQIIRCRQCQIALWSHYAGMGERISFVRVGTLDEPRKLPPDIHIYTESKQPWVQLSNDVPAVAQYYSARELWPAESQQRYLALKAASKPG